MEHPVTGDLQPKDIDIIKVTTHIKEKKFSDKKIRWKVFEGILNKATAEEIEEMILFAGLKIHKKVSIGDIEE